MTINLSGTGHETDPHQALHIADQSQGGIVDPDSPGGVGLRYCLLDRR
jgi:hypothetical protein